MNYHVISSNFSHQQVKTRLAKLNTSKSAGPDNIHPCVLRELKEVIGLPLSLIFRTSYTAVVTTTHLVPKLLICGIVYQGCIKSASAFENRLRKALSCHLMESSKEIAYIINI